MFCHNARRNFCEQLLLLGVIFCALGCASGPGLMVTTVPVTDLRRKPHTTAQSRTHDPFEESQLLYGERVRLLKVRNGWAYVEAIEQPEYTHNRRWRGYPGWVPEAVLSLAPTERLSDPTIVVTTKWTRVWQNAFRTDPFPFQIPLGTRLKGIDIAGKLWKVELLDGSFGWIEFASALSLMELEQLPDSRKRQLIIHHAEKFIDDPYYWGGRSPFWGQTPQATTLNRKGSDAAFAMVTGVDCSGLVNLAYRASGLQIPRDAHEQFLRARAVNILKPADLIFLSEPENPKKIVHVILYAGNGQVIEGPGTGLTVRRIALIERLDLPLEGLESGDTVSGQSVFFGTYLP